MFEGQSLETLTAVALLEPSLEQAIASIIAHDTDRAVRQALKNDGKSWETCTLFLVRHITKSWKAKLLEQGNDGI